MLEPQVGKAGQRAQQVAQRVQAKVVVTKLPGEEYHEAVAQIAWAKSMNKKLCWIFERLLPF